MARKTRLSYKKNSERKKQAKKILDKVSTILNSIFIITNFF